MRLKELRKEHRLSLSALGRLVGRSRMTVHSWEKGLTSPDINDAQRIAQVFDVTLDELVKEDKAVVA